MIEYRNPPIWPGRIVYRGREISLTVWNTKDRDGICRAIDREISELDRMRGYKREFLIGVYNPDGSKKKWPQIIIRKFKS